MDQPATKPRIVLVGIDYSETSDLALTQGFELARVQPDVELHLVHVIAPPAAPYLVLGPASMPDARATLVRHAEAKLSAFANSSPSRSAPARVVCHVRVDEPAHQLAQLAADLEADLILVGTHGRRAASRLFLGSIAEVVVRLAPCPVLVVRPKAIFDEGPRIEPPCPKCLEARQRTDGAQYWCEQHLERHGQRHTYHQGDRASSASNFPLVFKP